MAKISYNKKLTSTQVRVGEVRFSYANVFTPRPNPSGVSKYSCSILIPKDNEDAVRLIREAIAAAQEMGKASIWGGKVPKPCRSPLRDGDLERDDPDYEGCWFINASANADKKPKVKIAEDGITTDALDGEEFYSGCYGAAVLNFYPYGKSGNNGVGAGLNMVIKTRDGDRLGGGFNEDAALAGLYD